MIWHTPEPWTCQPSYHGGDGHTPTGFIIDSETKMIVHGTPAASMLPREMKANAERIVACVNGCAGINPEAVPAMFEVLKRIVECNVTHGILHNDAVAAIANAEVTP